MLDKNIIIEKMKSHFPRWMDIRKRVNDSKGGKLLWSIAETIEEGINAAITDYKKDFFIDGYFGREDSIVDILYKLSVGTEQNLTLLNPSLLITDDIETFFSSTIAYYNNGFIYIKRTDITADSNNKVFLNYSINNITFIEEMEQYHVWNIFDEFATFVGLRRHDGETNIDLEKRILNVFKDRVNSTENGLKNAIINELLIYDPSILKEDIIIEPPTPENLIKYYDDLQTVLDYLGSFNHDVYKTKIWDADIWEHSMAKIDYLPHAWDIAIENYQNGIGFEDDLNVSITDPNSSTNVTLNMYVKDKDTVVEYYKNSTIDTTLPLVLKKYSNDFAPQKAQYRIKASSTVDITDKLINIEYYNNRQDSTEYQIQNLISESDLYNISIEDNSKIDNKSYRLVFNADSNGIFEIKKANLIKNTILIENDNFVLSNNKLIYKECKALLTKTYEFNDSTNVINTSNGMALNSSNGSLKLEANSMNNELIDIGYNCDLVDLNSTKVTANGLTYGDNKYTGALGSIEINDKFNQISIDITGNNYSIIYTVNGVSGNLIKTGSTTFKTDLFKNPVDMSIKIINLSSTIEISNLKYSCFNINLSCDSGNIANNKLPDVDNNTLNINIDTETLAFPIINYVYIGQKCGLEYAVDIPSADTGSRYLDIDTRCTMTLYDITNGMLELVNSDYKPYKSYMGFSDNSYVKLTIDNYSSIDSITVTDGHIETINSKYFLFIDKNKAINSIFINGTTNVKIASTPLKKILNLNDYDKLYVTELTDGIIIDSNNDCSIVSLTNDKLINGDMQYRITGPDDVLYLFKTGDNYTTDTNNAFDEICIKPKDKTIYTAVNEYNVLKPTAEDITIINTFYPAIDTYADLYYYQLESLSSCSVSFKNDSNWHLGIETLKITSSDNSIIFDTFTVNMPVVFSRSNVIDIDSVYEINSQVIKTNECIVVPPTGCSVYYKQRTLTADFILGMQTEPEYYYSTSVIVTDDGFSKLQHSNIDEILYIGSSPWSNTGSGDVKNTDYTLLKDEGVIEWNNYNNIIGNTICILYTIKIPSYLDIDDIHILYDKAEYVFDSYKLLHKFNFYDLKDGYAVDLNKYSEYKTADKILAECTSAGFDASIKNGILTIRSLTTVPVIAIKTGYFYDSGSEYYLFNSYDKNANKVENTSYYNLYNVDVVEGQMQFHEKAMNMISNSSLEPSYLFNTINIDFNKNYINGISRINSITACDSLNFWNCLGQTIKLVSGYNDLGIEFTSSIDNGYSFIDITDGCLDSTINAISLYARGDKFNIYIGQEKSTNKSSIEIIKTLSLFADNLYGTSWNSEVDTRYYLIVNGACVVDDIILSDTISKDMHKKNIDILEIMTSEQVDTSYVYSIRPDIQGAYVDGLKLEKGMFTADAAATNTILLQSISDKTDYQKCILSNLIIDDPILLTDGTNSGSITTPSVYIPNFDKLDSVLININNILFDNMKGLSVSIYGANKVSDNYVMIGSTTANILTLTGKNIMPYIKIKINVPAGKIIDSINIYANYKEAVTKNTSLVYMSKIYDAQSSGKYNLNSISISSISNINDVDVWIRAAKENYDGIFMDWVLIKLDSNLNLAEQIIFDEARYFQLKVQLNNSSGYIQINNIDLEMI